MILENFIVFEGIDGAGTSTQIRLLQNTLKKKARRCHDKSLFTSEPTKTDTGKFLRAVLSGAVPAEPGTRAYLFAADRYEHIYGTGGIRQAVQSGGLAVSDRYLFSSLVYQGLECGDKLPVKLNSDFPLPQYLFYFDLNPKTAVARISGRKTSEIYENLSFLEKAAAAYRNIIKKYERQTAKEGMRIIIIDASAPVSDISSKIWNIVSEMPIVKE